MTTQNRNSISRYGTGQSSSSRRSAAFSERRSWTSCWCSSMRMTGRFWMFMAFGGGGRGGSLFGGRQRG
eukprot:562715-Pyramimonas_sp.AAC.1